MSRAEGGCEVEPKMRRMVQEGGGGWEKDAGLWAVEQRG
jgi:hypothetical protein